VKAEFSLTDITDIKRELGNLLPDVKSSHRVEAMARGLGWNTNAALLAELKVQPALRSFDNQVFTGYLKEHGFPDTTFDTLGEAVVRCKFEPARASLKSILEREPALTRAGFGVPNDRNKSLAERRAEREQSRAELLKPHGVEEFLLAREFLSYFPVRRTINLRAFSYGLKHRAEGFHRDHGIEGAYVSNGALIAAAIGLGFNYRVDGPNAYFNMGAKLKQALPHTDAFGNYILTRPPRNSAPTARQIAWRNLMVAGINAGLDQRLFGLDPGQNYWEGDNSIYRLTIAGTPAIACVGDAGYGELVFHVAADPKPDAEKWISASNAGFLAGSAFAVGWLERRNGKWLQTSGNPICTFRRKIVPTLAEANVSPSGYLPQGRVMI